MGDFQINFKIMVETQGVLAFLKVSSSTSQSPNLIFKADFLKRTINFKSKIFLERFDRYLKK